MLAKDLGFSGQRGQAVDGVVVLPSPHSYELVFGIDDHIVFDYQQWIANHV